MAHRDDHGTEPAPPELATMMHAEVIAVFGRLPQLGEIAHRRGRRFTFVYPSLCGFQVRIDDVPADEFAA